MAENDFALGADCVYNFTEKRREVECTLIDDNIYLIFDDK